MASITAAGIEYPLGQLTGAKAAALMGLWGTIEAAGDSPAALASPRALEQAMALCAAFGMPAQTLPLHELIAATRSIVAEGAKQWAAYLAGPVRSEIELTAELAKVVVDSLKGEPNASAA